MEECERVTQQTFSQQVNFVYRFTTATVSISDEDNIHKTLVLTIARQGQPAASARSSGRICRGAPSSP